MEKPTHVLGVDIGGTGMKAAILDVAKGELIAERIRVLTPKPANAENMSRVFKELVDAHNWHGPIGIGFPSVIIDGVAKTAANIDKSWIGTSLEDVFSKASGCEVKAVNDADAAGLAIVKHGAAKNIKGVVLVLTIGTGIGSGLFIDGKLVPNTELGHLKFYGDSAEKYCSNIVRKDMGLSYKEWGKRLNEYLLHVNFLFNPKMIVLGGGVSKKFHKYQEYIDPSVPVIPAELQNAAGTIGAAMWAAEQISH